MNSQISADMAAFTQPPPGEVSATKKIMEEQEKRRKADEKLLKPEQIKMAQQLSEQTKAEDEAYEKSQLIQRLSDYVKLVKEFHPERAEFLKVPKSFGPKNSCEELRIWINEIQTELGKKGGLDVMKLVWVEGFKVFEKVNVDKRFGLNVTNLGVVAEHSILPRRMADGTVVPGPAVPTLAEFCCKHSSWFSTDVDVRLIFLAAELVAQCHRMNERGIPLAKEAEKTPVSKDTKDKMDAL